MHKLYLINEADELNLIFRFHSKRYASVSYNKKISLLKMPKLKFLSCFKYAFTKQQQQQQQKTYLK